MIEAILYTDGGARGNPGPAAAGAVLKIDEKKYSFAEYLGKTTNNQAEYRALILGLTEARKKKISCLKCLLDSELIVKQINRQYRVKNKEIFPLFIKVWNLSQEFREISFNHISRDKNKEADRLVNQKLDSFEK